MKRETSILCYHQIKSEGLLSKRRFEVFEAIYKNAPCTTNEALRSVKSGAHGIGSRTTELRDLGVIYEKQTRKCKVSGRMVIEWDLTDNIPNGVIISKQKKKPIVIGSWFILQSGADCDGVQCRPRVQVFSYKEQAIKEIKSLYDWSDGIQYELTKSLDKVMDYCNDYEIDFLENININS